MNLRRDYLGELLKRVNGYWFHCPQYDYTFYPNKELKEAQLYDKMTLSDGNIFCHRTKHATWNENKEATSFTKEEGYENVYARTRLKFHISGLPDNPRCITYDEEQHSHFPSKEECALLIDEAKSWKFK